MPACCACATRPPDRLAPGDELIVEWRALTVALLDELAPLVREAVPSDDRCRWPACSKAAPGPPAANSRSASQRPAAPAGGRATAPFSNPESNSWPFLSRTSNVHLVDHPLVQHKLTLMRNKEASTNSFRRLLNELAMLMAYEVTRDMPMQEVEIETPLEKMTGQGHRRQEAGVRLHPARRQRHPGRHAERGARRARGPHRPVPRPKTLTAVEYYFKMPHDMEERDVSSSTRCWPPATPPSRPSSG
jgi:hypothetical protein